MVLIYDTNKENQTVYGNVGEICINLLILYILILSLMYVYTYMFI